MKKILLSLAVAALSLAASVQAFVADKVAVVKDFGKAVAEKAHDLVTGHMLAQGLMLGLITSVKNDAQSTMRGPLAYSHFDDAAVPAAIVLQPGFRPRYVKIINVTDRIAYEWFDGMAKTDYVKTVAAGTVTLGTDSALSVDVSVGVQPSVTLVAAQVLQNKQYRSIIM